MLIFYERRYFGACYVSSPADIKAKIHIRLKIQWASGICCGGMRLPCVGIFTFHRVQKLSINYLVKKEEIRKITLSDLKRGRPACCGYAVSQPPDHETGCEMTL